MNNTAISVVNALRNDKAKRVVSVLGLLAMIVVGVFVGGLLLTVVLAFAIWGAHEAYARRSSKKAFAMFLLLSGLVFLVGLGFLLGWFEPRFLISAGLGVVFAFGGILGARYGSPQPDAEVSK